jgi:hypothetical protein
MSHMLFDELSDGYVIHRFALQEGNRSNSKYVHVE